MNLVSSNINCSNFRIRYFDVQKSILWTSKQTSKKLSHAIRWLSWELLILIKIIKQAGPYMPINLSPQAIVKNGQGDLSRWGTITSRKSSLYSFLYFHWGWPMNYLANNFTTDLVSHSHFINTSQTQ